MFVFTLKWLIFFLSFEDAIQKVIVNNANNIDYFLDYFCYATKCSLKKMHTPGMYTIEKL